MSNLATVIDRLGVVKALKENLYTLDPGPYEGDLFRVTVSHSTRETLDMDAVREHLSRQFIQAHTRTTSVTVVRVTARNGRVSV